MTGYLQRLALSAVRPAAIHPVRASIFSNSEDAGAPEPHATEEEIVTTASPARSTPDAPHSPIFRSLPTPGAGARPQSASLPAGNPPEHAPNEADHAAATRGEFLHQNERDAETARQQPEFLEQSERAVETSASPAMEPAGEAPHARDRDVADQVRSPSPERPFVPLLEVQVREPAAPATWAGRSSPAAVSRYANESATRYSHPARMQPDEIEIHIGRIEVTAVQAAPPSPATPRRQTPSLDDYLRRRNGGAS